MAINAHRQYGINANSISKSIEKLSSGYRINRAGDDAAGLAISEKMRAQIRGLNMASKNSLDAISLIQTAEGALQSIHNVLQRMRELAVQASSDTNEQTIDRGALQQEFAALIAEINDTSRVTTFNDQTLLDGTFASFRHAVSSNPTNVGVLLGNAVSGTHALSTTIKETDAITGRVPTFSVGRGTSSGVSSAGNSFTASGAAGQNTDAFNELFTLKVTSANSSGSQVTFSLESASGKRFTTVHTVADISAGGNLALTFDGFGTLTLNTVGVINAAAINDSEQAMRAFDIFAGATVQGTAGRNDIEATKHAFMSFGGQEVEVFAGDTQATFSAIGVTLTFAALQQSAVEAAAGATIAGITEGDIRIVQNAGQGLIIQTGANQGDEIKINVERMDALTLGIYSSNIASRVAASNAITQVNAAVNRVSTQRAALGAMQNRMEFKIANLDTSAENLQAAESRIRDIDMAKEMSNFTKQNILLQASTAMLAQANMAPQNVLALLR
jgi:flagellin